MGLDHNLIPKAIFFALRLYGKDAIGARLMQQQTSDTLSANLRHFSNV